MTSKLNRRAYEQLIAENIAWLEGCTTRTLERDHIIDIVRNSVTHNYPPAALQCNAEPASFDEWAQANIQDGYMGEAAIGLEAVRAYVRTLASPQAAQAIPELKTKNLNLSVIRERNAAIGPHSLGCLYACDVVALIDDVIALAASQDKGGERG